MTTVESVIVLGLVVLGVAMFVRHRRENPTVDMDHKAPNVHNVVTPAATETAAKPAAKKTAKKKAAAKPAAKKVAKKAPAKKTAKKTTKKTTTKK